MKNDIELKPCPFCGGEAKLMSAGDDGNPYCVEIIDETDEGYVKHTYIHCYGCDMDFYSDTNTPKEMIDWWDRRADNEKRKAN